MYSPRVNASMVSAIESRFKTTLRENSIPEVQEMLDSLSDVWDEEGNPTRNYSAQEELFVRNELLMCSASFPYFAERYLTVTSKEGGLVPMYPLFPSQQFILKRIAAIEEEIHDGKRSDGILVNLLKGSRQIGGCLTPDTPILTADLRWMTIAAVQPGQEIVAIDEEVPGGKGRGRKLRRAIVEGKRILIAPTFEIRLANGSVLRATGDHRFLSHKRSQTTTCWRHVRDMKVGDRIRRAIRPWAIPYGSAFDDGWFGGMIDGEGCLRKRSSEHEGVKKAGGCTLFVSQVAGPVYDRLVQYLLDRHIQFSESVDKRLPGDTSKLGSKPVHKIEVGALDDIFQVVGTTRPTRFVDAAWWEGREPGQKRDQGWSEIISVTPLGPQTVIDLQTSCKTYIANGFVSHNSTLAEAIICHRITTQNYLNALIASDKPEDEGSAYLYGMQERMLTSLPRFIRPTITDRQKNREIKTDGGCHLMVGAGKSTRGITGQRGQLGRGTTLHLIHLSEVSTWDNAGQIDDALMHAIPRAARVFVMFESTAKGRGPTNWWHHHWHVCKYSKTARFRNIFVPWYVESTYAIEAPLDWSPSTATLAAAHRIEETSPLWAGERVSPSRSQLYWYEVTRKTAEEKGKLKKVMEEMLALDDEGCFQHAGEGIFPEELIQAIEDRARPMLALLDILPRKILQDKTRREAELLKSPRPKTLEQQYNDLALADDEENASA